MALKSAVSLLFPGGDVAAVARPVERCFEPVVAPEKLAVPRDKSGRAEHAGLCSELGFLLQFVFILQAVRAFENERSIRAEARKEREQDILIRNRTTTCEFLQEHLGAIVAGPALRRDSHRHARGEQTVLWEGIRPHERKPERAANAFHVPLHVAAFGGVDVERRGIPTLRLEEGAEHEWAEPD